MQPTYDGGRTLDDQPLAAYGGSGMELSAEDEARIELVAEAEAVTEATDGDGPSADLVDPTPSLDLAGEPGAQTAIPLGTAVAGLGLQLVILLRTSRVAAGVAIGGVILLGLVLLAGGGPKPGDASVQASPSLAPVAVASHAPGSATLVLTGKLTQTLSFPGVTGVGIPGAPIAATWTDTGLQTLGLEGAADRGTRYTDKSLVLRFTVMVKEKPISFTSDAGECTIGMAVTPTNISGTFTCRNLESDDGKLIVGATGTYRT